MKSILTSRLLNQAGFTLLEVLTTIALISILLSAIHISVGDAIYLTKKQGMLKEARNISNDGYLEVLLDGAPASLKKEKRGNSPFANNDYELQKTSQGDVYVTVKDSKDIVYKISYDKPRVSTSYSDKCLLYLEC